MLGSTPRVGSWLERLENRRLLSTTDLGALVGRAYLINQSLTSATYRFKITEDELVQAQVSNIGPGFPAPDLDVVLTGGPNNVSIPGVFHASNVVFPASVTLEHFLPAGSYSLAVNDKNGNIFAVGEVELNADDAPVVPATVRNSFTGNDEFVGFSDGPDTGRDFGQLSDVPASQFDSDFVGRLDGPLNPAVDDRDFYEFTVPVAGTVSVKLDLLQDDPSGFPLLIDVQLFHDVNHDGIFNFNESIATKELTKSTDTFSFNQTLNPGRYGFLVDGNKANRAGGSNYRVRFGYTVPDHVGNTLATAADLGTISSIVSNRVDFVGSQDTTDIYKFNVGSGGPFVFNGSLTGISQGADLKLELLDGAGNVLQTSDQPGNLDESVSAAFSATGTHFIRVTRVSGASAYTVNFSLVNGDRTGNTLGTARTIDAFGLQHQVEFVSASDPFDVYRINLSGPATIQASFPATPTGTNADLQLIQDANGDGSILLSEIIARSETAGNAGESLSKSLSAGTYFLRVRRIAGDVPFDLAINVDTAGDRLSTAADLGAALNTRISEAVTRADSTDTFKFKIGKSEQVGLFLLGLSDFVDFTLGRDGNGDGVIGSGETIFTHAVSTGSDISKTNLTPGTYFATVLRKGAVGTNYLLAMFTAPTDNAGNTPAEARNLGTLDTNPHTFSDFLGVGTVAQMSDLVDFYKFTTLVPAELATTLSGAPAAFSLTVFHDFLGDGALGTDDLLADSGSAASATDPLNGIFLPEAGTYFVRVQANTTTNNSTYTLSLTRSAQTPFSTVSPFIGSPAEISNTAPTRIEAENFDNGGEGIAYHDSDAVNDAGQHRTDVGVDIKGTNDTGGGFRVTDTLPGEFVEYTIKTLKSINYDMRFRLASPGHGATFHVEIDGASVTGAQTVPFTNGFDAMTDLFARNIPISAGPHILRLAFDTGASDISGHPNFAGSFNFIEISPSAPGTFELAPASSTIKAGTHTTLALTWTVPSGSWHLLEDVQLRIRDDQGTILRIKFDEASGTFSLYHPSKHKFGPGKTPGSNGVLSNKYVKIRLSQSSVHASGPTSPSVTLTFDITFKKSARGRHFRIEAAADDDLGHRAGFAPAGTIDVVK